MYTKIIKRILDISFAFLCTVLFSPVLLLVSTLIFFAMGKPVFFTQKRPGHKEKIFTIYKFRTMTSALDTNGKLLSDEERLNGVGKLIRSLSLDELPQMLNVLKGEMSFVGPRPLLEEYLTLYNKEEKKRHNVKPGITGWAQVNGRNAISWEEKFSYDVWYVEHQSFKLDMKILWMTCLKVLKRSDVSSNNSVSMGKFEGSKI